MIRNWYNQIPYPALKTKREITKYINWQQLNSLLIGKSNQSTTLGTKRPSGHKMGQKAADLHHGITRTPIALSFIIFLNTLVINVIGGTNRPNSKAQFCVKAQSAKQDIFQKREKRRFTFTLWSEANQSMLIVPNLFCIKFNKWKDIPQSS